MRGKCDVRVARWLATVLLAAILVTAIGVGAATEAPPLSNDSGLSPEAALETVRFMVDADHTSERNPQGAVSISPDGQTYVARLVRGDVGRNGVWMTMITGRLDSLDSAAVYRIVAQRFTTGLGVGGGNAGANQDTSAQASPLQWTDRDHVAFLWSDARGLRQVVRVNVRTGHTDTLTQHDTAVVSFDVSADGRVVYCAQKADVHADTQAQLRSGFVIDADTDAPSLMLGRINEGPIIDRLWSVECFERASPESAARRVMIAGRTTAPTPDQRVSLAPKGDWALINTNAPVILDEWDRYEHHGLVTKIREARRHPRGLLGRFVYQLWVLDTHAATSHALWAAPAHNEATQIGWSPDATAVVIAPTFLPPDDTDPRGRRGTAAAVVDHASGRYEVLPVDLATMTVLQARWRGRDEIELDLRVKEKFEQLRFSRRHGEWQLASKGASSMGIRLELHQDLNTPPTLVAVDPTSRRSRVVLDPNPHLTERFALGQAQRIVGQLPGGEGWEGLLLYPSDYRAGARYPLVIQSVYGGRIRDEFTLYGYQGGYGLGPAFVSPYVGRLLSARGIFVLHVNLTGDLNLKTPSEPRLRQQLFEAAAEQLIAQGLVQRDRVGLAGFSRNGFYVEYTLTHSTFAFAAALAADHWDASYTAQTLIGYDGGGADVNDGLPFGDALPRWLANAPGFGAQRVRAPLLQIEQSRGVLGVLLKWELFSRLRYLKKPVEFYVVRNAPFGVHNTQNPQQILDVQTRSIDWFTFWLQGTVDPDPAKQAQYERWRALRILHEANMTSADRVVAPAAPSTSS